MTDGSADTTAEGTAAISWNCNNCGKDNSAAEEHCNGCGYIKDYDPEAKVEIDFGQVQETIQLQDEQKKRRLYYIIEFTKIGLLLVVAVTFLLLYGKLVSDWPFMGVYERDADTFAGTVLAIESRLGLGVSKQDYDLLVAESLVEMNKFSIKYSESKWRHSSSYTKLKQAAEYYEIAKEAWDHQLIEESMTGRIDQAASSTDADESIVSLWNTASSNLTAALEDLR